MMMLFFDDDGPKSLLRSTLMVRMFPATVISTFFIPGSLFSWLRPFGTGPGHQP